MVCVTLLHLRVSAIKLRRYINVLGDILVLPGTMLLQKFLNSGTYDPKLLSLIRWVNLLPGHNILQCLPLLQEMRNNHKGKKEIKNKRILHPFKNGTVVDLIREEDNPHDVNAIRVEINGETVGYVANSRYTLIKEVSSATDIRNSDSAQAMVEFVLFIEWVIAKLI